RSPACFFSRSGHHRDLHSFPTRRSSDLAVPAAPALGALAAVFSTPAQLAHLAVLGVVCSAFAYLAMNACQPKVTAAEAGMIYCIDRKSTRLNSSHVKISYAVFCLKKKSK